MPKCLTCTKHTTNGVLCPEHAELPEVRDRFVLTKNPNQDRVDRALAKLAKKVWWDEEKKTLVDHMDVEWLAADNPQLIPDVFDYMDSAGYGQWHKAVNPSAIRKMTIDIEDVSGNFFTLDFRTYPSHVRGRNGYRLFQELNFIDQTGYKFTFYKGDWRRVRKLVETYFPLSTIPAIKAKVPQPGDLKPMSNGRWTCHLALNEGQIVGGSHLTTLKGDIVAFNGFFDNVTKKAYRLNDKFGQVHVAPATLYNLNRLISVSDQPWDLKWEAAQEMLRLTEHQKAIASTFQWRLHTELYSPDGLHRYVYEEQPDILNPWGNKFKVRLLEHWDRYIAAGYKLYSHQKVCAEAAWKARRLGLWLDMRLGKTLTAIAVAKRAMEEGLVDRIVVVAPVTNLYEPWEPELSKQGFTPYVCDSGAKKDAKAFGSDDYDAYLVSYESLRNRLPLMQERWDMQRLFVIMDETSAIKNHQAQRAKTAQYLTEHPAFVLALNGTPMEQGPADIWSQQYCIDRGRTFGTNYDSFLKQYMRLGHDRRWRLKPSRATHFEMALAGSAMRYIRSEGDQFAGKDKNFRYVALPPTFEMKQSTNRIISGFQMTNEEDAQLIKACILVSYGHLREAAAGYDKYEEIPESGEYIKRRHKLDPKAVWVRTFLKSNPAQPLICFCEFSESEDRLMEMLKSEGVAYSTTRPHGGTPYSPKERQRQVQRFNNGTTRVFICKTVQARGITLNRIEAVKNGNGSYPSIVYMQPSWSLGSWKQSQDRAVGTDPVTKKSIATMIYVLAIQGSIEMQIVKALRSKQKVAETLLKDSERDGYSNPFEEMNLSGREELDDYFDAEDYEARYVLNLPPPPRKLSEKEVRAAGARLVASRRGVTVTRAKGYPLPMEAAFLLNKSDELREAIQNGTRQPGVDEDSAHHQQEMGGSDANNPEANLQPVRR